MHPVEKMCRENPSMTALELAQACGVTRARVYGVLKAAGLSAAPADRRVAHESLRPPEATKQMKDGARMTSSFRGDISEILVAGSLMAKGLFVYRSLSGNAPFDLLAYSDGKMWRVEVRTGSRTPGGEFAFNWPRGKAFDVIAAVSITTGEVRFIPPDAFD